MNMSSSALVSRAKRDASVATVNRGRLLFL